jgi:tRNA pseudouridine32 synthase / 23S rRNA pseudouridine746 synthase
MSIQVPPNDDFKLIECNEQFIVIDKMPGISFHTEEGVLGIVERVKATLEFSELYPVHRLDKMTSGLLILARTEVANRELSALFRERLVEKYYLAISDRKPTKKQGLIKGDMARSRRRAWKLCKSFENPAITQFISTSLEPGKRLYLVRPKTGKTHQIRVALKSIGAPVMGDTIYSAETAAQWDRGYLHAFALKFELNKQVYSFTCLPSVGKCFVSTTFEEVVQQYSLPWELKWPGG